MTGTSNAEVEQFDPASFRDPAARVLRRDGQILRYLTSAASRDWVSLSSTKFFKAFTASGRLVATKPTTSPQAPPLSDPWVTVLRHQTIPVVSYPYEWCFSMLQDAALLQLDLLLASLDEGMTLKDSTPFNIQWVGAQPVFIDIGSFKVADPAEPWTGYRQFCEMFLYPLFLQAYKDVPFHPWLRGSLEGVEARHCNNLTGRLIRQPRPKVASSNSPQKHQLLYGSSGCHHRNTLPPEGRRANHKMRHPLPKLQIPPPSRMPSRMDNQVPGS